MKGRVLKAICARRAHNFVYFEWAILRSSYLIYYWYTNKIFWAGNFAKLLSGSSNQWVRGLRAVRTQVQVSNYLSTYLITQLHRFSPGFGYLLFTFIIMLKILQDNILVSALQPHLAQVKNKATRLKAQPYLTDKSYLPAEISWQAVPRLIRS